MTLYLLLSLPLGSEEEEPPLPSLPGLHLEHLFQEIHFQHFVIYTKRDEFLRRHIAKGHCGTDPSETNNFFKIWLQRRKAKTSQGRTLQSPQGHGGWRGAPHPEGCPTSWPDAGGGQILQNHGFGKTMASRQVNCFAKGSSSHRWGGSTHAT